MPRPNAAADAERKDPRRPLTHLMPTLLQRLQDDRPAEKEDGPNDGVLAQEEMRAVLRHDLALLFNTINHESELNPEFWPEVASSVLNYGIPPISGGYVSEMRWTAMEKMLRTAITRFEPRLMPDTLSITPISEDGDKYNVLQFKIQAYIHMDPYPLEFALKSSVDLENHKVRLEAAEAD